jgi:hypothetical protein
MFGKKSNFTREIWDISKAAGRPLLLSVAVAGQSAEDRVPT